MHFIKNTILVFISIIFCVMILSMNQLNSYASVSNLVGPLEGNVPEEELTELTTDIIEVINKILGFLQVASAMAAVVIIAMTGYEYIVATPDVKSEIKRKMTPIVIGMVLIFSASSIAKFILGAVE